MSQRTSRDGTRGATGLHGDDADVNRAIHLAHRRRGWVWVAVVGLVGLIGYAVIGVNFFQNLTGVLGVISVIPLFLLLALIPVAAVAAIVDTVRLRRYGPATLASAAAGTSHYSPVAHAYRYPPRHRPSWLFGLFMLVILTLPAGLYLPKQVDGIAYLAGAGNHDTFIPVSHQQVCGKGGCRTVTDGVLKDSGADVTWPGTVPLSQPFSVRASVWMWGSGRTLIDGTGGAVGIVVLGLFFDFIAAVTLLAVFAASRHRLEDWLRRLAASRRTPEAAS